MTETREGLEGVIAAETELSSIDGDNGVLRYRGYDINDLAEEATFEEVAYLLWQGELPTEGELETFEAEVSKSRGLDPAVLEVLREVDPDSNPMAVLRTGVSALSHFDTEADVQEEAAHRRKARRILAKMPTIVAAFHRLRQGDEPLEADPDRGHAEDFLRMLTGEEPSEDAAATMDTALVLHADHGLNASTFTARVIASTLSDMYAAVTGAVGALKGPLHGGANQAVMEMLEEIGSLEHVDEAIQRKLDNKEKIMGFGHRVYNTMDPRATILRRYSERLGQEAGESKWFEMSTRIQEIMQSELDIDPNVDFYSASTYRALGIPKDLYTAIFAMSRAAGWTAHVLEQYDGNRLIRPRGKYVGPASAQWVDLEDR